MPNILVQTSPVVGISFCLIIVRLGAMTPEVREDSWQSSQHSLISRTLPVCGNPRLSRLNVPIDRVKVERDVYISESVGGVMGHRLISPASPGEKFPIIHRIE